MSLDQRELVERVVQEVIRCLEEMRPGVGRSNPRKVLVLLTGGSVGYNTAVEELKRLKTQLPGVSYSLVMSRSAARIFDPGEVRDQIGAVEMVSEGAPGGTANPSQLLRQSDLVAVPVLTRHTAARVAALLNDTLAAEMILDGLLLGKPVVAVENAANPAAPEWEQLRMNKGNQRLIKAYQENLKRLEGFGIDIVPADQLARAAYRGLIGMVKDKGTAAGGEAVRPAPGTRAERRLVLTRLDVLNLSRRGGVLCLPPGTVLTPLAADAVREMGLTVNEE